MTNTRRHLALEYVTVAALGLAAAIIVTPHAFALDDAYISLHSARVLLSGHDPIFDAPALTGVTSPAYVALLVLLLRLGFSSGAEALRLACILGAALYVSAIWAMTRVAGLSSPLARAGCTAIGAAAGLTVVNVTNGLETGWAMALLAWLIVATATESTRFAALLSGALPFFRPDLAPAAGLLLVFSIRRCTWRERAIAAVLVLIVAAPFVLWVHANTGAWVPETMRAKAFFFAEGCQNLRARAGLFSRSLGLGLFSLFPLVFGYAGLTRDGLGRVGLAAMVASLTAYFLYLPSSLSYSYCRYLYPIAAPWCCWGIARLLSAVQPRMAGIVVAAALLPAAFHAWAIGRVDQPLVHQEGTAIAEWVENNVAPDAVLLVHDSGVISEAAHRRAIDLVGLKTADSIGVHARITWPSCGMDRGRAVSEIARKSGAAYIILNTFWDEAYDLRGGLVQNGLQVVSMRQSAKLDGYSAYRLLQGQGQ